MIDACYLDIESYQYKPRAIVISVMFLVLGKHFSEFTFSEIAEHFPNPYWVHQYFQPDSNPFLALMNSFIYLAFGFCLDQVMPTIQYVAPYFVIPFMYNLPQNIKNEVSPF